MIFLQLFVFCRVYPYLCRAVKNFVKDYAQTPQGKEYYVSFTDVPTRLKWVTFYERLNICYYSFDEFVIMCWLLCICRVREMTTAKIGTLLRISGQVVRTHPVHPELVLGTFMCLDCRTVIPDVEQQFKFTQVNWYTSVSCSSLSGLVGKVLVLNGWNKLFFRKAK